MSMVESSGGVMVPEQRAARLPAQQDQRPTDLIGAIASAASNPAVDVEKMERLMAMHERLVANEAQQKYQAALSEMQPELPVVRHRGNANGRYTYALWEDIHRAITPILQEHGFAIFFQVDTSETVRVSATLTHAAGHRESTSITLPADSSGNKNAVQAVASSVAYGKRYTAGALLNFATTGEDDDAQRAVEQAPETITEEQANTLRDLLLDADAKESALLDIVSRRARSPVEALEDIPAAAYEKCVQWAEKQKAPA